MSFVRDIWTDLVEKTLWPVALLLIGALIAIVVLLGSTPAEPGATAATGATGATSALGAAGQVSLEQADLERNERTGVLRNPFKPRAKPVATGGGDAQTAGSGSGADLTASAGSVSPSGGGTSPLTAVNDALQASAGSSGDTTLPSPLDSAPSDSPSSASPNSTVPTPGSSSSSPSTPTPSPPSSTAPTAPVLSDYVTEIRAGRLGEARPPRTVARLTPLPTVERPFFVYLGVLTDRRTAVFLLSSDVRVSGQAKCKPDESICETIEMRAGQTAELTVTDDDATVTRYALTVDDVRRRGSASSPARKGDVPARTNTKDAAKRSDKDLGTDRYRYDDKTGLLRRVRAAGSAGLDGTLPGIESGSVFDFPGVWGSQGPATGQGLPSSSPLG